MLAQKNISSSFKTPTPIIGVLRLKVQVTTLNLALNTPVALLFVPKFFGIHSALRMGGMCEMVDS